MPKYKSLDDYIDTFNADAYAFYIKLKEIINLIDLDVKEKLFAGQIAFYVLETLQRTFHSSPVIVMSFLKDHVNIFANANKNYSEILDSYNFTDKYTMQIKYNDSLNTDVLIRLFKDSLQ